jgi:hypothetical protein
MFFSEEKNQKTFASWSYAAGVNRDSDIKVFCWRQGGLRLFFKKEGLL